MRVPALPFVALLAACSSPAPSTVSCPADRLSPDQSCLAESCGPGEVRIGEVCTRVGNTQCANGFVSAADGGCASTLPESCADPLVAFPGDTACHELDACGVEKFAAVDGPAVYVDQAGAPGGDGSASKPVRTMAAGISVARATKVSRVLVAEGTYAERLLIDFPLELRGVCSGKVTLAAPKDEPGGEGQTTVTVAADATIAGLRVLGAPSLRAFTAVGGASLSLDHVSVRNHLAGVEIARVANPKVPRLRLTSVTFADAVRAVDTEIPFELSRVHVRGAMEAVRVQADGTLESSVLEDGSGTGLTIKGGRVDVRGVVVRRFGGSEVGDIGIFVSPSAGAAAELSVSGSVFSDIEGAGISADAAPVVVQQTTVRGISRPKDKASAGMVAARGAHFEMRDSSILGCAFAGFLSLDSPTLITRSAVVGITEAGYGAAIAHIATVAVVDFTQRLQGVLVERSVGSGIYLNGTNATLTDVRIRDIAVNSAAAFGDGFAIVRGTSSLGTLLPAMASASNLTVERAARAGVSVFGAELSLSGSRLCAGIGLAASAQTLGGLPAAFKLDDGGHNVCGCGAPLRTCQITNASFEPMPLPRL